MELVSVVVPCYNPGVFLRDALKSAKAQTYTQIEIVLVDDGTDAPDSRAIIDSVVPMADRFIRQANRGLPAARNAGISAAQGSFFVPLDADDVLAPEYIESCLDVVAEHPEAAFVYTDYRVFGDRNYVERLADYNLFRLLLQNNLTYAALIRKSAWFAAGGYDEALRQGYEDWDFWLRLAEKNRFGHHLRRVLFKYRRHGYSLWDAARERHDELSARIRSAHPKLYSYNATSLAKAQWEPAVCLVGRQPASGLTIQDWEAIDEADCARLLTKSRAGAYLIPAPSGFAANSAELAALAVWGGNGCVRLPDGSVVASRGALSRHRLIQGLKPERSTNIELSTLSRLVQSPEAIHVLLRHLRNAELLSFDAWLRHPFRCLGRLIPLRFKSSVNRLAGCPVFDLSFYLRFQPEALLLADSITEPLRYFPKSDGGRRCVVLITPHLGPGGAESVLLDVASALDRSRYQILVIATQSNDRRWLPLWTRHADHIYDLSAIVPPDRIAAAVYSIIANWRAQAVLVQNALPAYAAIPHLRRNLPGTRILDLVHAVGDSWDLVSCTAPVANDIDVRIVISEAVRDHLRRFGTSEEKIRLIRNGVDAHRFLPVPLRPETGCGRILFAGRLDSIKRPLLLVEIARALCKLRPRENFRIVVAGDGPEEIPLRKQVCRARVDHLFEFLGHVPDIAPVLADSDLLVLPSRDEGIPLIVLEAFACGKPVVASDVGAIGEVVDRASGFLIAVQPGEVQAFAQAINRLLNDSVLREKMGMGGRRRVEAEYSLERAHEAYREILV